MKQRTDKKKTNLRKPVWTCKIVCPSDQKEIAKIEGFLQKASLHLHIDDGTMYRLMVSCTEAVNNAIVHGNNSDPKKKVVIRCTVKKHLLTIFVKDEGKGFDPDALQDPRDEKNLLKENGRGVFLMRSLMDSVTFKHLKAGSVVEMKVKIH